MIERWFPCAEVSANSRTGWGSGNAERNLFTWFAARPTAQAKAAVITSLLPWPDDETEQHELQKLVKKAMTGRHAAWEELRKEILKANPEDASVLDPFSGRGMIPLEAARLALPAHGVDYSPVAVLASELLTDYPYRNWDNEPVLPFAPDEPMALFGPQRLVSDVEAVLGEIGRRHEESMKPFYPEVNGQKPWGYLWAVTLPCQECGNRFPLVGNYELRKASRKRGRKNLDGYEDPGQSFYIDVDRKAGTFEAVVHVGPPQRTPTLTNAVGVDGKKIPGKSAICTFCDHVHPTVVHRRMAQQGLGEDRLLVVAEHGEHGKVFREPTDAELRAVQSSKEQLASEAHFSPLLPAVPHEGIAAGNGSVIQPSIYGARTFGDLMCDRQTLAFARLSRTISSLAEELVSAGVSLDYARCLSGYAGATMVRMLRYSTRGAWLRARDSGSVEVAGIFVNESSISFSYDFFEAGPYGGAGTWSSMSDGTMTTLRGLCTDARGTSVSVMHGTATSLPFRNGSIQAVVTDPPYDEMIAYADTSDLFFAWLKRALYSTRPEMSVTLDPHEAQDKTDEIIVKKFRAKNTAKPDHRTRQHYDTRIAQAFSEMRRVVRSDGVVSIVFGHGDPEVWQRFLSAISSADLVMTGSWPATTESGGQKGAANIQTTLTMACRPAREGRPLGRKAAVEAEVRNEVISRVLFWEKSGLAPTDMLMAAAGPAMEVVGRYSQVLDSRGEPVDISTFLPLARHAVQEAMAVEIDHHPLESFDARTRFALWWMRIYGRQVTAKSELRWQALAASMDLSEVRDLVPDAGKGCSFVLAERFGGAINPESPVIDVVLAMAKASEDGLAAVGEVLLAAGRDADDVYPWAAMKFLADRLPDSDPDAIAWSRILRNRTALGSATRSAAQARLAAARKDEHRGEQLELM
jgi:adenine-specific DNA methylase